MNESPMQQAQATRDQIRDQIRQDVEDAVRGAQEGADAAAQAAAQAAGAGAQAGVSVTTDQGGARKVITVPDGHGGVQRIEIGEHGINIDGQPMTAMDFRNAVPTGAVDIAQAGAAMVAACVIGFPLARAFGRWLDRRGTPPAIPPEVLARLSNIENAVETVAVEVERISEGQRFTTKLLNQRATHDQQDPLALGDRR